MKQTHKFQEALADILEIYQFLDRAPGEIAMTKIMAPHVMEYRPVPPCPPEDWGVMGFVLIAESHISIHTYPDKLYLSLDIFSCKKFDVNETTRKVIDQFKIARMEVNLLDRGLEFPRDVVTVKKYLQKNRGGR